MTTYSNALAITTSFTQIALGGSGQELTVFGLVLSNNSGAERTITFRLYNQAAGSYVDIPFYVGIKEEYAWPKPVCLQPGDYLSVKADATGVAIVYSIDADTGTNPVATNFNPRGAYSAGATYAINDVASESGTSYISLQDGNIGNTPSSSPSYWMINSAKGETGANTAATDVTFTPTGNIAATNVQTAIAELDGEKQPLDATLTAFASVTVAADKLPYGTGADAFATTDLTAFARTLLDDADAPAALATLGVTGKQSIPIPAGAMTPATTNGAASGKVETGTYKVMLVTQDFDATTAESVQFAIPFGKGWNEGATITYEYIWKHAATTTNFGVAFGLSAVAVSNDDAGDVAFGTEVIVTDTGGTTNDIYRSAESAAVTIAGSPAVGDTVFFKLRRVVSDGADNMAIDAGVIAVVVHIITDAGNDA